LWNLRLRDPANLEEAGAQLVVTIVAAAWSAIIWAGQIHVSLDLARRRSSSFRRYLDGIRHAPRLFVVGLVFQVPMSLAGLTLTLGRNALLFALPVLTIVMWLLLFRGAIWVQLVVDRKMSLAPAGVESWRATRGAGWSLAAVYFVMLLLTMPIGVLTVERPLLSVVFSLVTNPPGFVLWSVLYLALAPRGAPLASQASEMEPASLPEDLPVRGTGWSRSIGSGDDPE
jgi:hypothetical protein